MISGLWRAGGPETLGATFFYLLTSSIAFAVLWPMAVELAAEFQLGPLGRSLLVATPLISSAILRVVAGLIILRHSARLVGLLAQSVVIAGIALLWASGLAHATELFALAALLGLAGAAFSIVRPHVAACYPAARQRGALAIVGFGEAGIALAAVTAPLLAMALGWRDVVGLLLLPLVAALIFYVLVTQPPRKAPPRSEPASDLAPLGATDGWWFMCFYAVTLGGYLGLSSTLTIYFSDVYGLSTAKSGAFAGLCALVGALARPLGAVMADRMGGIKSLSFMYVIVVRTLVIVAGGLPLAGQALAMFLLAMLALGMGNGAIFHLVPQRFRANVSLMTCVIGAAGTFGGFLLATALGASRALTGSYAAGFLSFAALALVALTGLTAVKRRWRTTWAAVVRTNR
jgi:NNP family nitrate/nitrite transporter-like MFS transporter